MAEIPKQHVLLIVTYGDGDDPGLRVHTVRFRTYEAAERAMRYMDKFSPSVQIAGFDIIED
jgi:hypothetical protein